MPEAIGNPLRRARLLAGCIAKDLPLYLSLLAARGETYLRIRNRAERLETAPDASGYRCDWRWTSELHAPKLIPALGRYLMKRALLDHPIELGEQAPPGLQRAPAVSFLIGHRGTARVPHLLLTLRSIAGQRRAVECIVVEQDAISQLGPLLPPWVTLVHTPPPVSDMPYCRSWAFNVGARHARGHVLILHDNDMLVPADYAAQVLVRIGQGYDAVNLKRFVFYLTRAHSAGVLAGQAGLLEGAPAAVVQNAEAGGSVAITRSGFERIGGMDESFIGWGGEDNEFWERAQALRPWPWANLPLVHLWHEAQPGRQDAAYHTARRWRELAHIPPADRIQRLLSQPSGRLDGPVGFHADVTRNIPAAPAGVAARTQA